jgi:hypothetical protein
LQIFFDDEKIIVMIEDIFGNIKPAILSEILRDIAQVFFAAVLIEPIINSTSNPMMWLTGLVFSLCFWSGSIYLNNKKKL